MQLSPFVTKQMKVKKGRFDYDPVKGPYSGEAYLSRWKKENGVD
jgi:hypothetical protein